MIDILFRGKDEETLEWIYGCLITIDEEAYIISEVDFRDTIYDIWKYATKVIPETVGQYTGVLDMNNKKIFDGDIFLHANKYLNKVFWCNEQKGFYIQGINFEDDDCLGNFYMNNIEVLGNIYDNPELLEVSD